MNPIQDGDPGGSRANDILNYFSVSREEMTGWEEEEIDSLDKVVSEVLEWKGGFDRKNIFLVEPFDEKRRNRAAAYIAKAVRDSGRDIVLVNSPDDLPTATHTSKKSEHSDGRVYFLIFSGDEEDESGEQVLERLEECSAMKFPAVVSAAGRYIDIFRMKKEEESHEGEHKATQSDTTARGFTVLGIAIFLTPFLTFPYIQVPLGNNSVLNDVGIVTIALTAYGLLLLLSGRRGFSRGHAIPMAAGVLVFVSMQIAVISLSAPSVAVVPTIAPGSSAVILRPSLESVSMRMILPTVGALVSLTIFPLGFAGSHDRNVLITYFASSVAIVITVSVLFSQTPLINFLDLQTVSYYNGYLEFSLFQTGLGNSFMESLFMVPISFLFMNAYLRIGRIYSRGYENKTGIMGA